MQLSLGSETLSLEQLLIYISSEAVSRKVYWFAPGSLLYALQSLQVNIPYIDLKGMTGKQK